MPPCDEVRIDGRYLRFVPFPGLTSLKNGPGASGLFLPVLLRLRSTSYDLARTAFYTKKAELPPRTEWGFDKLRSLKSANRMTGFFRSNSFKFFRAKTSRLYLTFFYLRSLSNAVSILNFFMISWACFRIFIWSGENSVSRCTFIRLRPGPMSIIFKRQESSDYLLLEPKDIDL